MKNNPLEEQESNSEMRGEYLSEIEAATEDEAKAEELMRAALATNCGVRQLIYELFKGNVS